MSEHDGTLGREAHTTYMSCWDCGHRPAAAALFWGGSLITIGALLLLIEAGIFSDSIHNLLWPGFLIALGAWVLTSPAAGLSTGQARRRR